MLYQFFKPGKHLVIWRNFEDLLEKLIYYYNHSDEAEVIAKTGKIQAENNYATTESLALTISEFVLEIKLIHAFWLLMITDVRINKLNLQNILMQE